MSAEPREFWIEPEHNGRVFIPYNESKTLVEYSGAPPKSCLLVIEHSAYQALEQKLADLQLRHDELLSYLPKIPTQPYEKELAQKLAVAVEALELLKTRWDKLPGHTQTTVSYRVVADALVLINSTPKKESEE